jgi:hypothetical protein
MSETTEPDGSPAPEPEATPTPAPESTPDTDEPAPAKEADEERQSRGDRRFAELTARLSAAERREQQREQELEFLRRQMAQQAPQDETPEQRYHRERAAIRAEVETQIRIETFHNQGQSQFTDWKQRCDDLVKMGADGGFAQLLVEMPDGVKVAAALAADPAEVERIANLRNERARAVALGKYAATIEDAPPARGNGHAAPPPAPPQVTRAPAPIRPVTGRAAPTFNEYTADGNTLVDRYMKQHLDQQIRR